MKVTKTKDNKLFPLLQATTPRQVGQSQVNTSLVGCEADGGQIKKLAVSFVATFFRVQVDNLIVSFPLGIRAGKIMARRAFL